MSDPTGISAMIRKLRDLKIEAVTAMEQGMDAGAANIEAEAAATTAYAGMSGATRASTIAYVATEQHTGAGAAQAAYGAAAAHLTGFQGHEGQPYLGPVPGPGPDTIQIVETVPTDYIAEIEFDNAGAKAFLADALHQQAPQAFDEVVQAVRGVFQ